MRPILLAVAVALIVAPTAGSAAIYTAADWLKRPTAEMLRAAWPAAAAKKGIGGKTVISCKVSVAGALFDCKVAEETPAGSGFGAAAIAMTPQLLMRPATLDGKPVVSEMNIPFNFKSFGPFDPGGMRL